MRVDEKKWEDRAVWWRCALIMMSAIKITMTKIHWRQFVWLFSRVAVVVAVSNLRMTSIIRNYGKLCHSFHFCDFIFYMLLSGSFITLSHLNWWFFFICAFCMLKMTLGIQKTHSHNSQRKKNMFFFSSLLAHFGGKSLMVLSVLSKSFMGKKNH